MFILIIQARMGSTRLPGKVLHKFKDKTMLEWCIQRCLLCKKVNKVIVASSINAENDIIENLCKQNKIECYRGSENDVLDRYYTISKMYVGYDDCNIIRITSDCPLVCPYMIDDMVNFFNNNSYDYITNHSNKDFITPEGSSIEIFKFKTLKYLWEHNKDINLREHVTGYLPSVNLFDNKIKKGVYNYLPSYLYPNLVKEKLSVDTEDDYNKVKTIVNYFDNYNFSYKEVLDKLNTR